MTATTSSRNIGIDLLRVFSIIMVVVGHAGTFQHSELLTIWRMPLFFMLSGFFFTAHRSMFSEWSKRWNTLIIPYLGWSVVISVWLIIVTWGQDEVILDNLHSGWSGGSGQSIFWMAAWFITTLAAATLLRRFVERFSPWVAWVIAIAGLVFSYVGERLLMAGEIGTHPLVDTPLRLGLAWPVLFYLLVGEQLRKLIMPLVRKYSAHVLALIGLVLVVGTLWLTKVTPVRAHFIQAGDFGTPVYTVVFAVLITTGLILIFATWVNTGLRYVPVAQSGVGRLVRTGTSVVFCHGLVLVWMHQNGFGDDTLQQFLLRIVVALVVSFAVGLLINSTPASRLLSGAPREPALWRDRASSDR